MFLTYVVVVVKPAKGRAALVLVRLLFVSLVCSRDSYVLSGRRGARVRSYPQPRSRKLLVVTFSPASSRRCVDIRNTQPSAPTDVRRFLRVMGMAITVEGLVV